jgi:hypothetical protein
MCTFKLFDSAFDRMNLSVTIVRICRKPADAMRAFREGLLVSEPLALSPDAMLARTLDALRRPESLQLCVADRSLFYLLRNVLNGLFRIHFDDFNLALGRGDRSGEVNAADRLIIMGSKVPFEVFQIGDAGPKRIIGMRFAFVLLAHDAGRYVECVQDMKGLKHRLRRGLRRQRRLRIGDRANQSRRRREIAR